MRAYLFRRSLIGLLTVLGVATATFLLLRVMPGDPAVSALGDPGKSGGSMEQVEALREQWGLNKPIHMQYFNWLWGAVRFDFGDSLRSRKPVLEEYMRKVPVTASIVILSTVLTLVVAVPAGIISALKQDTAIDYVVRVISLAGLSLPSFWVAVLIIVALVRYFQWLPPIDFAPIWVDPIRSFKQFILPAFAVAFATIGMVARLTRSAMLEVMREDYVRTARAKGLQEQIITYRHALRNAILPVMTAMGMYIGFGIGGLIVVEVAFNVNGVGRYLIAAVQRRDYPVVEAVTLAAAFFIVATNILVDIMYAFLDPRIRYT